VQPGTMLSRWECVRYAGVSTLGLISVASALLAIDAVHFCIHRSCAATTKIWRMGGEDNARLRSDQVR
jgi:hypothetical protein